MYICEYIHFFQVETRISVAYETAIEMFGQTTETLSDRSRRLLRSAIILHIVGFVVVVIGVCFPHWVVVKHVSHSGIFQWCAATFKHCMSLRHSEIKYNGDLLFPVLWGLSIAGLFTILLSSLFMCTYPLHKIVDHCKVAMGIFVSFFLMTGVILLLATMIIYVDYLRVAGIYTIHNVWSHLGFAWYLTGCGLVILVASVACFILHMFFMVYYK